MKTDELEFWVKIIRSCVRIGKKFLELLEKYKNKASKDEIMNQLFNHIMEREDNFTAFVFGILTAETCNLQQLLQETENYECKVTLPYPTTFSQAVLHDFFKALLMLKEGKSEKEIIEDFVRSWKEEKVEKFKTYI